MQTILIKVTRYHEGTNEKSAYMVFFTHNHYQIVYLYFSVFQLVSTNCFSILFLICKNIGTLQENIYDEKIF